MFGIDRMINHILPNSHSPIEVKSILDMCELHDQIVEIGLPIDYWSESIGKGKIDQLYVMLYNDFYMSSKKIEVNPKEFMGEGVIERSKLNELRFFIGDVIQNDRYTEGLFHKLVNDQVIERILQRAKQITKVENSVFK